MVDGFNGDKDINNLIVNNLRRISKKSSESVINISFNTIYTKKILAKNLTEAKSFLKKNPKIKSIDIVFHDEVTLEIYLC